MMREVGPEERAHRLLTVTEAAEYLAVSRNTVHRLVRAGAIPAKRVGRQWRFCYTELQDWVRGDA